MRKSALAGMILLLSAPAARSQDLLSVYRAGRFDSRVEEVLEQMGRRVRPLPLSSPGSRSALVARWIADHRPAAPETRPAAPAAMPVERFRKVQRLERGSFERSYRESDWTGEGLHARTHLDTVRTEVLRGQLQARFGAPTQTIVEIGERRKPDSDEHIQFEYWFVVNDTIPLVVMDVDGPYQRGLVLMGDRRHQAYLAPVKAHLAAELAAAAGPAPYADSYYSAQRRQWVLTGYDGRRFFARPIAKPDFTRGRPRLN